MPVIDIDETGYSRLDRPEILMFLFHPRRERPGSAPGSDVEDIMIPVEEGVSIGARLHPAQKPGPVMLFFHGNGEIVSDYDDIAPLYSRMGITFLPVDYRGYGRSTGKPTVTAMMRDCHVIFDFLQDRLRGRGYRGPLIVMGRSLGSTSALELAAHYGEQIDGLVIESGLAYVGPLLRLLGVPIENSGIREEDGFRNVEKIRLFSKPTLIIHAENDHIIPFSDGRALYEASTAENKRLIRIRGADHNNILFRGLEEYMGAINALIQQVA
ncbi:MAG: alpha/beta fold hydrolase [Deltaproteobacteria bacterium]|jgi:alpha-beta hydrolase superfamily lysophospholipase